MGADFLCFIVGMPIGQEPRWDLVDDKQWKEAAETWIKERGDKGADIEGVIKDLKAQVAEVKDAWNGGYRRDASVFHRGHEKVLITGGLSWGDDPTDMFATIQDLYDSGLIDTLGFDRHLDDAGLMEKLDALLKSVAERGLRKEAKEIRTLFHQLGAKTLFH